MWEMFLMPRLLMAAAPEQHRRGSAATLRSLQAFTGATRLVFGTWRLSLGAPLERTGPTDGKKPMVANSSRKTILVALPLSVGGALGFLLITGEALGISPLIGILMLMGIAAKNSILLVEYALVAEKERGMSRFEALLDAARKRARPIVMTSIAMGAGMLPIALGIGADAETRAPMAIAVIGGPISSTLLSLVYVPVVYTFMDDIQRFLGRHLSRLLVEPSAFGSQAASAISGKDPAHAHPV